MSELSSLLPKELEQELGSAIQRITQEKADKILKAVERVRLVFSHNDCCFEKFIEPDILKCFTVNDVDQNGLVYDLVTINIEVKVDEHIVDYVFKWMYDRMADISRLSRHPNDPSLTSNWEYLDKRDTLQLWMLLHVLGINFAAAQIRKSLGVHLNSAALEPNYAKIDQYIPHAIEQQKVNQFNEPKDEIVAALVTFGPGKFAEDFRLPQLANFTSIVPPDYDTRHAREAAAGNTVDEYKDWQHGRRAKKPEGFDKLSKEDKECVEKRWTTTLELGES